MDELSIRGLEISALIGVRDWERRVRQTVVVDLDLTIDARRAGATDQLKDAVDYGAVARRVTDLVAANESLLIETLAERIAATITTEFAVARVRIALHKPGAVPNARDVVLTIERPPRAG
jgi:dihydroneopterin aldolase